MKHTTVTHADGVLKNLKSECAWPVANTQRWAWSHERRERPVQHISKTEKWPSRTRMRIAATSHIDDASSLIFVFSFLSIYQAKLPDKLNVVNRILLFRTHISSPKGTTCQHSPNSLSDASSSVRMPALQKVFHATTSLNNTCFACLFMAHCLCYPDARCYSVFFAASAWLCHPATNDSSNCSVMSGSIVTSTSLYVAVADSMPG